MTVPFFSILLPIFNTPSDFLEKCLETLAAQTFRDFEVVAIDDGYTHPETVQVLEK